MTISASWASRTDATARRIERSCWSPFAILDPRSRGPPRQGRLLGAVAPLLGGHALGSSLTALQAAAPPKRNGQGVFPVGGLRDAARRNGFRHRIGDLVHVLRLS